MSSDNIPKIDEESETTIPDGATNVNINAEQTEVNQLEIDVGTQTNFKDISISTSQIVEDSELSTRSKAPSKRRGPRSLTDPIIMENAYYICHDIADFLLYRGYKQGVPAKK